MKMKYKLKMGKDLQPGPVKTHTALPWGLVDHSKGNGGIKRIDISPDPKAMFFRPIASFIWNEEDERRGNHIVQRRNAEFILKACHCHYPLLKALSDVYVALSDVLSSGEVVASFPESVPLEEIMDSAERILLEVGVKLDAVDRGDGELSDLGEASEEGVSK